MAKYVFLTGASGLVGRYLMKDLLKNGERLAVLIRSTKKETAQQRLDRILQIWEKRLDVHLPRPICFSGDVNQENLGLDENQMEWVRQNCDSMIHNAAILDFEGKDRTKEPWRTNFGGTKNVIQFSKNLGIKKMHYVSTAYVSGLADEIVKETELDRGQTFRNDYEHSKFEAEKAIRAADFESLTVYRPVVISGDSENGFTNTYHGLYMYMKLMSVVNANTQPGENGVRYTPIRLDMSGEENRNVVPVDWISSVMTKIFLNEDAHGRTFHLAPKSGITPRQLLEAGQEYFNSTGVEFVGAERCDDGASHLEKVKQDNTTIYQQYEQSDPVFDTTNLDQFTSELPCPTIDKEMFFRYWEFAENDRWGKRRPEPSVTTSVAEECFGEVLQVKYQQQCQKDDGVACVGIDCQGPGGGQFTFVMGKGQIESILFGISDSAESVLTLDYDSWSSHGSPAELVKEIENKITSLVTAPMEV